ncbi:MAG: hypothetical protein ACT6Q3_18365, partial [Sphingopyxis sp.]
MLARSYARDLTLVGAAAAAPPTDLAANLREGSDKNARALLLSFTLHSWSELYGFSLDAIANRTNQGIIHRLAQNNCVSLENKPKLGAILGIVTVARATKKKDIATIEPWGSWARSNSVDPARVPGWFWYYRQDPEVRRWLTVGISVSALLGGVLVTAALLARRQPLH